jgi:hypothetical protein
VDGLAIGRIVHYVPAAPEGVCNAALVTEFVQDGTASLSVFCPYGVTFQRLIPHNEGKLAGTWHWPERA